jgi:hypothetical protein
MTTTPTDPDKPQGSSSKAKEKESAYTDKNGTPIPDDHFENEPSVNELPLDPAGRRAFEDETARLMQFKRKADDEEDDNEDDGDDGA